MDISSLREKGVGREFLIIGKWLVNSKESLIQLVCVDVKSNVLIMVNK